MNAQNKQPSSAVPSFLRLQTSCLAHMYDALLWQSGSLTHGVLQAFVFCSF